MLGKIVIRQCSIYDKEGCHDTEEFVKETMLGAVKVAADALGVTGLDLQKPTVTLPSHIATKLDGETCVCKGDLCNGSPDADSPGNAVTRNSSVVLTTIAFVAFLRNYF